VISARFHHPFWARAYNTVVPSSRQGADRAAWDANCVAAAEAFSSVPRAKHRGRRQLDHFLAHGARRYGFEDGRCQFFEEFKGTGNSEIHLDRRISEKRTFPFDQYHKPFGHAAKEELITEPSELSKMWIPAASSLHPMDELAAIEFLLDKMKDTKTNSDFLRRP